MVSEYRLKMFLLDCKKTNNLLSIGSYEITEKDCSLELLRDIKNPSLDKILEQKTFAIRKDL